MQYDQPQAEVGADSVEVKGGMGMFSPKSWDFLALSELPFFTAVCGDLSISIMTPVWPGGVCRQR